VATVRFVVEGTVVGRAPREAGVSERNGEKFEWGEGYILSVSRGFDTPPLSVVVEGEDLRLAEALQAGQPVKIECAINTDRNVKGKFVRAAAKGA